MTYCEESGVQTERVWGSHEAAAAAGKDSCIRVWLVDDSRDFRELLAEVLDEQDRINCSQQFSSGQAVVEALRNQAPPDVILMDIHMRGQNGLDSIRPIKSMAGSVHVIMLTTFYDSRSKARALQSGATDFLLKSYTAGQIAGLIRQAVRAPARSFGAIRVMENIAMPVEAGHSKTGGSSNSNSNFMAKGLKFIRSIFRWNGRVSHIVQETQDQMAMGR